MGLVRFNQLYIRKKPMQKFNLAQFKAQQAAKKEAAKAKELAPKEAEVKPTEKEVEDVLDAVDTTEVEQVAEEVAVEHEVVIEDDLEDVVEEAPKPVAKPFPVKKPVAKPAVKEKEDGPKFAGRNMTTKADVTIEIFLKDLGLEKETAEYKQAKDLVETFAEWFEGKIHEHNIEMFGGVFKHKTIPAGIKKNHIPALAKLGIHYGNTEHSEVKFIGRKGYYASQLFEIDGELYEGNIVNGEVVLGTWDKGIFTPAE